MLVELRKCARGQGRRGESVVVEGRGGDEEGRE